MPTVSQLPAQLDAECVAGDPFSLAVTSSGATITSPTVTLKDALGATITGTVPTVSQAGAVTTVAFSAATTAALNTDTTRPVTLLWSLAALVNGAGPWQLVARRLTVWPVGTAGVSSASAANLAVTVGDVAVSLAVTGGLPGPTGPTGPEGGTSALTVDGQILTRAAGAPAAITRAALAADPAFTSRFQESHSLTNGVATAPRIGMDQGVGLVSGRGTWVFFTADKTFTANKVRASSRGTAASGATLIRFGLYAVDASGNGTLVASTANDTALFAATFTTYTKSLTSNYDVVPGQRYAAVWLVVATTPPILYGAGVGQNMNVSQPPRISGDIPSLADLPASFTDASFTTWSPSVPTTFILTTGAP